jgi:transcription elongation factor GreA
VEQTELTRETYERLKRELQELTTVGRVEAAKAIEAARALGDLSENGDYHAAKDHKSKLEARIKHLENLLKNAKIVEKDTPGDCVTVGVTFGLCYEGEDEVEICMLGSIEEQVEGVTIISPNSPLGQAVLGKPFGSIVSYKAPHGSISVKIVNIK